MTDRELLERAAKAAGMWATDFSCDDDESPMYDDTKGFYMAWHDSWWNPLQDDGDSARLEAALLLNVEWDEALRKVYVGTDEVGYYEPYGSDRQAARRRAGVRAAAAMAT